MLSTRSCRFKSCSTLFICTTLSVFAAVLFSPADVSADEPQLKPFPGDATQWNGFVRHDFEVDGKSVLVVSPDQPAEGNPWVWHGEFFGHKPAPDIELLRQGFHVVYLRVPNMLGSPQAVAHWDRLYDELTRTYGLSKKVSLVGLSRGGLYCYNWAAKNPEKVACIYGDAPVCDFKSWPGGQGAGKGSPRDWGLVLSQYGFDSDAEANQYDGNPVDSLASLAKANVPLLHVFGDADEVVPWRENTGILADRYRALGGFIELIQKPGVGHHPHSLEDPKPIVDFIIRHASSNPPPIIKKQKLDPVDEIAIALEPSRKIAYKTVAKDERDASKGQRELFLHLFEPSGEANAVEASDHGRSCFVVIHGGGWTGGEPRRMYPFASHFAEKGMVGISVQYRLLDAKQGSTVFDSVSDVRTALRFIKEHHQELGIDPDRITVSGGSAGGHLAAATAMFSDINAEGDSLQTNPTPHSLVLLFPVIDTSSEGYGQQKIGDDWERLSPLHRVTSGLPPTLIFHGSGDRVTPYGGAIGFYEKMKQSGNVCELETHEGGRHGYLMFDRSLFLQTLARMEEFFAEHRLLPSRE